MLEELEEFEGPGNERAEAQPPNTQDKGKKKLLGKYFTEICFSILWTGWKM